MKELLIIFFSMVFVDNFLLSKFLGICSFLGVSNKMSSAIGMSYAVIFVTVLSTVVTWPIQIYILDPNGIGYLQTIVFILVIAALVQFVETFMKKFMPPLYKSLGVYLPLITTNCLVLGAVVININENYSFVQSLVNAFGAGIGYMVAMVIFAGVRVRIENNNYPKAFVGVPIILVSASILSLSFMGFSGVVEGIFG